MDPQYSCSGTGYDMLTAEAATAQTGSQASTVPYLMGERTPHLDANAGRMDRSHGYTRADLIRAAGRRVVQPDGWTGNHRKMGVTVNSVRVSGGGAEVFLASDARQRVWQTRGRTGKRRRLRIRRGSAGISRHGEFSSVVEVCKPRSRSGICGSATGRNRDRAGHCHYQSLYPQSKGI